MDVQIPPQLQWVSYLAGDQWPQGSETGMRGIGEVYQAASAGLTELIPQLNRVRQETLSVLFGDTAAAAEEQFALLFEGEYAVGRLAEAVSALGDAAGYLGSEIEYTKLSIVFGLASAAAEISWALANSTWTAGASLSHVPITEAIARMTVRQIVAAGLRRVAVKVRQMATATMVKRLTGEGAQESVEELAFAATEEALKYEALGHDHYTQVVDGDRLRLMATSSAAGGAAGGAAAGPAAHLYGPGRAAGVATFFTAGVVGNFAGAASVGQAVDVFSAEFLGGTTMSSVGGLGGTGVARGHDGAAHPGAYLPPIPAPRTPPATTSLLGSPAQPTTAAQHGPPTSSPTTGTAGQAPGSLARSAIPANTTSAPVAAHANGPAPAPDPSTPRATPTAGTPPAPGDDTNPAGPAATSHASNGDGPTPAVNGPTTAETHTGTPLVDAIPHADIGPDPNAAGTNTPASHDTPTPPHSDVQPATAHTSTSATPATGPTNPTPVTATPATGGTASSTIHPQTAGTIPPHNPNIDAPPRRGEGAAPASKPDRRAHLSTAPHTAYTSPDTSTPDTTTPATSEHTGTHDDTDPRPAPQPAPASRTMGTGQTDAGDVDPPHTRVTPVNDCVQRAARTLSRWFGRTIDLHEAATPQGTPPDPLFDAFGIGSFGTGWTYTTYQEIAHRFDDLNPGSAAIVVVKFTNPGRSDRAPASHIFLARKHHDHTVYFHDPSTGRRQPWPPPWPEQHIARCAAGYLNHHGQPIRTRNPQPQTTHHDFDLAGRPPTEDNPPPRGGDRDVVRPPLTANELEVVTMFAKGHLAREIAQRLSTDVATVAQHVYLAQAKLGARNLVELAVLAYQAGLLATGDLIAPTVPWAGRVAALSDQERQVLVLLAERGLTDTEIAARLGLSVDAVKEAIDEAIAKLGARHRIELVAMAYESGLVDAGSQVDALAGDLTPQTASPAVPGAIVRARIATARFLQWAADRYNPYRHLPTLDVSLAALGDTSPHITHARTDLSGLTDGGGGDFGAEQAAYRAQDRALRQVDTRYAVLLRDVVDTLNYARIDQLAEDLSGNYGDYRAEFRREAAASIVVLTGVIWYGEQEIGSVRWVFGRDADHYVRIGETSLPRKGNRLIAHHSWQAREQYDGQGLPAPIHTALVRYCEGCGVDRLQKTTDASDSYATALQGYGFSHDDELLRQSLTRIESAIRQLASSANPATQAHLEEALASVQLGRLQRRPRDLATLGGVKDPDLGRELMTLIGVWHAELILPPVHDGLWSRERPTNVEVIADANAGPVGQADGDMPLRLGPAPRTQATRATDGDGPPPAVTGATTDAPTTHATAAQPSGDLRPANVHTSTPHQPATSTTDPISPTSTTVTAATGGAAVSSPIHPATGINPPLNLDIDVSPRLGDAAPPIAKPDRRETVSATPDTAHTSPDTSSTAASAATGADPAPAQRPRGGDASPSATQSAPVQPRTQHQPAEPSTVSGDESPGTDPQHLPGTPQVRGPDHDARNPGTSQAEVQQSSVAVDDQSGPSRDGRSRHPHGDATDPGARGPGRAASANCGAAVVELLADHHRRPDFELAVEPTAHGVPARAVFEAVKSRAEFTSFAQAAEHLAGMESGSSGLEPSAVLTWSWATDGGRRGGHAAALVKAGDHVYLYDPNTKQRYLYDRQAQQFSGYWGQEAIAQMTVGYLHADGDAVTPLDGGPNDLADVDDVGWVQGPRPMTLADLRAREREAIGLLAAGLTVAQIAERMSVTEKTVMAHLERAMLLLGLRHRQELVVMAYELGAVVPEEAAPSAVVSEDSLAGLDERDRVVWRLVGQGLTNSDIAAELAIRPRTAEMWVGILRGKLGAKARTQMVAMAYHSGVLMPGATEAPTAPAEILAALTVRQGEVLALAGANHVDGVQGPRPMTLAGLRVREREAMELLAAGLTVAQVAARMSVTKNTVTAYLDRAVSVLGVRDRQELVVMAYELGVVVSEQADPSAVVSRDRFAGLDERDRVVWKLVGQGLTNSDIATELAVADGTAGKWVGNLKGKLGAKARTQMVAMAYQSGMLIPGSTTAPTDTDRLGEAPAAKKMDPAREPADSDDASRQADEAVTVVDGASNELADADDVGWVQGRHPRPMGRAGLREREREVIELLAAGLTVAQIAARMSVTRETVYRYTSRAVLLLGLRHRQELVVMAYELGAVVPEEAAPSAVVSEDSLAGLDERDRVVWRLVGQGLTNSDIAAELAIRPSTAAKWVGNLNGKLGAKARTQMVAMAYHSGVLIPGATEAPTTLVDKLAMLSARQRRVLALLARGLVPAQIDIELSLSLGTAVSEIDAMVDTLGAREPTQLVTMAYAGGLVDTPSVPVPVVLSRKLARLTDRDCAVLTLLGDGLSTAQIDAELILPVGSARRHITTMMGMLGARASTQLVVMAHRTDQLRARIEAVRSLQA